MADENNQIVDTNGSAPTNEPAEDYKSLFERAQEKERQYKASIDRLSSENAKYKRSEKERMTEEQKAEAERKEERERFEKVQSELDRIKVETVFAKGGISEEQYAPVSDFFSKFKGVDTSDKEGLAKAILALVNDVKDKAVELSKNAQTMSANLTPPAETHKVSDFKKYQQQKYDNVPKTNFLKK